MPVLPPGLSPEFLEPILKAELSKHKFLNLGGFLFGALVDATLFGMMMVMLGYWVSYVPKERLHVKVILVSLALFNCEDWYGRLIVAVRTPFLSAYTVLWSDCDTRQVWVVLCAIACTGYNCHLIWYHFIQVRSAGIGAAPSESLTAASFCALWKELWQMDAVRHGQV